MRALELSFWIAAGQRVYPEFRETLHCDALEHRARKVIYRAWDFGWHAPACLVAQIDTKDRLLVLREVVGHEQTTRQFAESVLERCAGWYPQHAAGFQDFCDPAGQQRNSTAEASEIRDVEILNTLGIYPRWDYGWSRKDGRSLVHQLLVQRIDGETALVTVGSVQYATGTVVDIPRLREMGVTGIFLPGTPMQKIIDFINAHARTRV